MVTLVDFGYPVLALLILIFAPKDFYVIWLSNLSTLSVPSEYYSTNVSCTLN